MADIESNLIDTDCPLQHLDRLRKKKEKLVSEEKLNQEKIVDCDGRITKAKRKLTASKEHPGSESRNRLINTVSQLDTELESLRTLEKKFQDEINKINFELQNIQEKEEEEAVLLIFDSDENLSFSLDFLRSDEHAINTENQIQAVNSELKNLEDSIKNYESIIAEEEKILKTGAFLDNTTKEDHETAISKTQEEIHALLTEKEKLVSEKHSLEQKFKDLVINFLTINQELFKKKVHIKKMPVFCGFPIVDLSGRTLLSSYMLHL